MKRAAKIIGNVVFYLAVVSILFSLGSQQFMGRAWGWSMVTGSSMVPTMGSGDLAFILPYFPGRSSPPEIGDVIAFEGNWGQKVIHRIVDAREEGYITKGDGNPYNDQEGGQPPVTPGKMHGTALMVDGHVVRIPMIGAVMLKLLKPGLRLPLIIVTLSITAILLVIYFSKWRRERPRVRLRKEGGLRGFYQQHKTLFKYSGVTILGALVLMSAMVRMSSTMDFCYGVSRWESGPLVTSGGVSLGTVKLGTEQSRDLDVSSNFPITMLAVFVDQDAALDFPQNPTSIPPKQDIKVKTVVEAAKADIGIHTVPVTMLILPPVLPDDIIYGLAKCHQLLAMFAVSLVLMLVLCVPAAVAERRLAGKEERLQMVRRLRQRGRA